MTTIMEEWNDIEKATEALKQELTYDEKVDNRICDEQDKADYIEANLDALQVHFDGLREWNEQAINEDNCYELFEDWASKKNIYDLKDALGQMDLEKELIKQNENNQH